VPAYTWEGTVGPVLLVNAGAGVCVDVDPDTYCLDAKLIEKAITAEDESDFAGASGNAICGHG